VRRVTGGDTWKKTISGGSRRADVMDTFWWEADVEGRRHGVEGVWMMRRKEGHVDHREEVDG
jgi:hypothetical protein